MKQQQAKLYLPNALFMGFAHAIGLFGFGAAMFGFWKWQTVLLGAVLYCVSGLGITVGYHRYFTHRAFRCGKLMQVVLSIMGIMAVENSIKSWVSDHVRHHAKVDTDEDPYDATKGFWYSHIGWILFKIPSRVQDYSSASHLLKDKWTADLVNFQHRYYYPLAIFFAGVLPILIAFLWGDPLGGLVFAGFSRLIIVWHGTFCINSLAHFKHWGSSQPYFLPGTPQDSWIVSLFTFGEGYHNYHHAFPGDYRNGPRWFNFDPSKWLIYFLELFGLTSALVKVPDEKIEAARLEVIRKTA